MYKTLFTSWPLTLLLSMNPDERHANESPLTLPLKFLLGFLSSSSFSPYLLPLPQEKQTLRLLKIIGRNRVSRSYPNWYNTVFNCVLSKLHSRCILCKEHQTPFRTSKLCSVLARLPTMGVKSICHTLKMGYFVNAAAQPEYTENIPGDLPLAVNYVQAGCKYGWRPQPSAVGCEGKSLTDILSWKDPQQPAPLGIHIARTETFRP